MLDRSIESHCVTQGTFSGQSWFAVQQHRHFSYPSDRVGPLHRKPRKLPFRTDKFRATFELRHSSDLGRMLNDVVSISTLSPSAGIASLQTSTFQVSNRTTGAAMSLIKKADVQNYLSARRRKTVFPFAPIRQPDATGYSGAGPSREAKVNGPKPRQVDGQEPSSISPSATATESRVDPARSTYTSTIRKPQS